MGKLELIPPNGVIFSRADLGLQAFPGMAFQWMMWENIVHNIGKNFGRRVGTNFDMRCDYLAK